MWQKADLAEHGIPDWAQTQKESEQKVEVGTGYPGGLQKPCPDCRDKIRKAKAQVEFKLARDGMANKNGSPIGTSAAKDQEKCGSLLNMSTELLTKGTEEVWSVQWLFFASVFTSKAYSQALQVHVPNVFVWGREVLSTVEEDFIRDHLIKLDLHRSMNVQETGWHHSEAALCVFEILWQLGDPFDDWKRQLSWPSSRRARRNNTHQHPTQLVTLTSAPKKIMEQIFLKATCSTT